jgi:hypothetical protein
MPNARSVAGVGSFTELYGSKLATRSAAAAGFLHQIGRQPLPMLRGQLLKS